MPFCPKCHYEYQPGSEVCPDCDAELVESLDAIKQHVTANEAMEALWTFCSQMNKHLYSEVRKWAQDLGYSLDSGTESMLQWEVIFLNRWIIAHALQDLPDYRPVLEMLATALVDRFSREVAEDIRTETAQWLKHSLVERAEAYSRAWDSESGGNQSVLAANVLANMFTGGEMKKSLLSGFVMFKVNAWILTQMTAALDMAKERELN